MSTAAPCISAVAAAEVAAGTTSTVGASERCTRRAVIDGTSSSSSRVRSVAAISARPAATSATESIGGVPTIAAEATATTTIVATTVSAGSDVALKSAVLYRQPPGLDVDCTAGTETSSAAVCASTSLRVETRNMDILQREIPGARRNAIRCSDRGRPDSEKPGMPRTGPLQSRAVALDGDVRVDDRRGRWPVRIVGVPACVREQLEGRRNCAGGQDDCVVAAANLASGGDEMIGNRVVDGDAMDAIERVVQGGGINRLLQRAAACGAYLVRESRDVNYVRRTGLAERE